MIDHEKEHYCPAYDAIIDSEMCYESWMCLSGLIKVEALPELRAIADIDKARAKCRECPYSDMS